MECGEILHVAYFPNLLLCSLQCSLSVQKFHQDENIEELPQNLNELKLKFIFYEIYNLSRRSLKVGENT